MEKNHGSLKLRQNPLALPQVQLEQLNTFSPAIQELPKFNEKLKAAKQFPLRPARLEIFQVNLGKMCNQTCKHCHVDAGPDRKEIMPKDVMDQVLNAIKNSSAHTVDITGGAPEMHPHFREFVEALSGLGKKIIVRCNLTIIMANQKYADLPEFYKKHNVHIASSLPYYDKTKTDRQRGDGVFQDSITALKKLNAVGYGKEGSPYQLDLVYNPSGAFLPAAQASLERDFKIELKKLFDIEFNNLFTITNMPISRFLEFLIQSENYEGYMEKLVQAFNPQAVLGVMCKNTLSVSWDGHLYDCDFNQMLDLKVANSQRNHIRDYNESALQDRSIVVNQHCYGCTAGSGSSCGGATA
ncbi:arsenosugar biosynthesis radical SAM (seleno)protein ArsS [Bdellovibrio sp. HCB337]|uniref:arsenosugar biosynthesis radical SAM (seleno)protein ArsS n=1 Tax=Bdellovibrio sp. HCB337 TaxID=3394358 RepID=UPI0039A5C943